VKGGRSEPVSPREETGKDPRKRRCSTPPREMKLAKGCSSPRMREGTPPQPQAQELVPIPFLLADSPPIPIPPRLLSPPRNTATTLNLGEPLPASISSRLMSLLLYPMPFSTTAASLALAFPPNLLFDTFLGFDPVSASSSQSATVILGWLAQEESTATEVKLFLAAHEHFRDVAVREFQGGAEWEWGDVYDEGTREEWSKATVRSPTPDVVDLVKHADPTPPSSPLSISSTSPRTPSRPFRSPSLILMPPTSPPPPPMKSTPPTAPALISTQGRTTTAGRGRGNQHSPGRVPNRPNLHSCPPAFKLSKVSPIPSLAIVSSLIAPPFPGCVRSPRQRLPRVRTRVHRRIDRPLSSPPDAVRTRVPLREELEPVPRSRQRNRYRLDPPFRYPTRPLESRTRRR
jgi:hypothetical protein